MSRDLNKCSHLLNPEALSLLKQFDVSNANIYDVFKHILDNQTKAQKFLEQNKGGLPLEITFEWMTQTYHFVHDEITEVYELFPSETWKRHKSRFKEMSNKPLKEFLIVNEIDDIPTELFFELIDLVHFIPNYLVPINAGNSEYFKQTLDNKLKRKLQQLKINDYKNIPVLEFMEHVRMLGIFNGKAAYDGIKLAQMLNDSDTNWKLTVNDIVFAYSEYLDSVFKAWNEVVKLTKILFDNIDTNTDSALELLLPLYDGTLDSVYRLILSGYILKQNENYRRWNTGY